MDWMPLFLCLASGVIAIPLLRKFQNQIDAINKKMRQGEAQIRECETGIRRMLEEEAKIKKESEKTEQELNELDRERTKLEKTLLQVKIRQDGGAEVEDKHF